MAQKTNMFGVQRVLFSLELEKYYKNDKSYKHTESIRPAKDFKCKKTWFIVGVAKNVEIND